MAKNKKEANKSPENIDDLLSTLLQRAKTNRHAHELVAERARAIYAGEPMLVGRAELPPANWNQLKKVTQNNTARVINGNPMPHIRCNDSTADAKKAEAYQKRVQRRANKSNLPSLLRKEAQDTFLSGNGYLEILEEDGKLEHISYFDTYVDNVKGDPTDMTECRYIFIRRLTEKELFIDLYSDDLKRFGIDPSTISVCGEDIPGRSTVGVSSPGEFYLKYDRRLSVNEEATGFNYSLTDALERNNSLSDETLVEYWTIYIMNENSPSGFERILFYGDKVFKRDHLPSWMFRQPVFCLPGDCVNGQFYQPSLLTSVGYTQMEVNWISYKISQNINYQGGPIRTIDKAEADLPENAAFDFRSNSVWYTIQNSKAMGYIEYPTLANQTIQHRQNIMNESDQQELVDIQQGSAPAGVTSGVALQTLESQANVRLALVNTLRDEQLRDIGKMLLLIDLDSEKKIAIEKFSKTKLDQEGTVPSSEDFTDDNLIQYMHPDFVVFDEEEKPLKIVTPEELMDDYNYTWVITPSTSKDKKMGELMIAINSAASIVQGDPRLAILVVDIAGIITGHIDESNEIKDSLAEYFEKIAAVDGEDQQEIPQDGSVSGDLAGGNGGQNLPNIPPELMAKFGFGPNNKSQEALESEGALRDRTTRG